MYIYMSANCTAHIYSYRPCRHPNDGRSCVCSTQHRLRNGPKKSEGLQHAQEPSCRANTCKFTTRPLLLQHHGFFRSRQERMGPNCAANSRASPFRRRNFRVLVAVEGVPKRTISGGLEHFYYVYRLALPVNTRERGRRHLSATHSCYIPSKRLQTLYTTPPVASCDLRRSPRSSAPDELPVDNSCP